MFWQLPIEIQDVAFRDDALSVLLLAKTYSLSSYDAVYLELASRKSLPIATLDKSLIQAANQMGIRVL